jgi:hypothetical protein
VKKPRLLDEVRSSIRRKHYSLRTEQAYVYWIRYFIRFHRLRHPRKMREPEVRQFLDYLALGRKDVKTTQIYTHVLNRGGRGVRSPLDIT